jgi:hypothetical protein
MDEETIADEVATHTGSGFTDQSAVGSAQYWPGTADDGTAWRTIQRERRERQERRDKRNAVPKRPDTGEE